MGIALGLGIGLPFMMSASAATEAALTEAALVASLFGASEDGVFYNPSDITSLYQSRTRGDVVTADGDVVGIMLDKSQMGGLAAADFIAAQPELVTNGTFDTDSDWIVTGASISGGVVNIGAAGHEFYQQPGFDETKYHAVTFTVTGSGSLYFRFGAIATNVEQVTTSGTYTFVLKPTSNAGYIVFRSFGFTGTLDNVSVKEIPGNHAVAPSDAARPLYKTDGTYHWLLSDGVDDRFLWDSSGIADGATLALAVRSAAETGYIGGIATATTAGSGSTLLVSQTTGGQWGTYGDSANRPANTAADDGADHVLLMNGTTSGEFRLDGAADGVYSSTEGQATGTAGHGHILGLATQTLDGRLYAAIAVDRVLTSEERSALEEYLASLSGVTL